MNADNTNESGKKYLREMKCLRDGKADVYTVIEAFDVRCPAIQHALKKLLCAGLRGKGNTIQDLSEARDAITRAMEMQSAREGENMKPRTVSMFPCEVPKNNSVDYLDRDQ